MNNAAAPDAVTEIPVSVPATEVPPRRARSLAWHIVMLGLAIAIPALLFSGYLLYRFDETQRQSAAQATTDAARSVRDAIDRSIAGSATTLQVLSTSAPLEEGDFPAFYRRASRGLEGTNSFVALIDRSYLPVVNTRLPYGTPAEPISNRASIDEPLRTGTLYVSDAFYGSIAKEFVFHIALPVKLPDGRHFSLIMSRGADSIRPIIEEQKLPAGWAVTVMDRKGIVVASSGGEKTGSLSRFASVLPDNFQPVDVEIDGKKNVVATRRSFDTGWRVVAFVPAAVLEAPSRASLALLLLAAAVLLALTVLLAIYFARRVAKPIMALADRAQALGHGEPVEVLNSPILEANEVSRTLVAAAQERQRSEDQIRFLMRELSHRAKNQLAVVVAMARRTGGDSDALRDFRSVFSERLLALARSTDLLVEQNWKGVPITELIDAQLRPFQTGDESRVRVEGPRLDLSADAAQNLGLALHELATNASKHGALSAAGGSVAIRWHVSQPGPRFQISWKETGGPPVSPPADAGFGSQVIQRTVAQALNGEVTHDFPLDGVVWTMEVALSEIVASPR